MGSWIDRFLDFLEFGWDRDQSRDAQELRIAKTRRAIGHDNRQTLRAKLFTFAPPEADRAHPRIDEPVLR